MARVGVDVGGTNTDLVLEADHGVFVHKVASTPHDQSEGVLKGLRELCAISGVRPDDVSLIVHGTTIATNITIEHNGAEVGMLTSRNFRDILHIGRHKRPYNFSLHFEVPWQQRPLVKRRNRIAVTERIVPPDGKVETPLNESEVAEAIKLFKRRGIKSVVIGFLFSFLNDAHERRAAELVRAEMPDAYICTSSEVANVIREYERFSTAAMNAFVGPKTSLYLNNLQSKLSDSGFRANLRVIQSNGGIATVETCAQKAVGILMSGPAGGVIGGRAEGMLCGRSNLITVDIGGTSADISTIPDGRIKIMNARDSYVNGHPILVPMIDLGRRWDRELGHDEQQSLAFARLLIHAPRWVLLDEILDSMDEETRTRACDIFTRELKDTAVIHVSRSKARDAMFMRVLHLIKDSTVRRLSRGKAADMRASASGMQVALDS